MPDWGDGADNKAFPALLEHDRLLNLPTHTYGGDKAYDDTDLFERIEQLGLHVGIKLRRNRTTKKDASKQRWFDLQATQHYQVATTLRSRVEQPFGQAKDKHGFEDCRYLGYLNYGRQSFLTFLVVNAKRMVKLLTGITFRELSKGRRKEVFQPVYAERPWASCVARALGHVKTGSGAGAKGTLPPRNASRRLTTPQVLTAQHPSHAKRAPWRRYAPQAPLF